MENCYFNKLRGKMKQKKVTQKELSEAINLNVTTLNKKLNMQVDFKIEEVVKICDFLEILPQDIPEYFF